jgi:hypothetical protein
MNTTLALLVGLAVSPLATAADWTEDITLVKDMVVLDKAYIPALQMSDAGDPIETKAALDDLETSWDAFQKKWKSTVNQEWQSGFERIDQLVTETVKMPATEQNPKRTHIVLEQIGDILFRLRKKAGIPYFVDLVTSTLDSLDEVVRMVTEKNTGPMASDEIDILENGLLLAEQRWKKVVETPLDKIVYRIDIYYMGDVGGTRAEGTVRLEELTRDVRDLDRAALAEKVERLVYNVEHFLEILGSKPGE